MFTYLFLLCLLYECRKRIGLLTNLVAPQSSSSKRTAAGSVENQTRWHKLISTTYADTEKKNAEIIGPVLAKSMMVFLVYNLDEECLCAQGGKIRVIGSASRTKHETENASSRCTITMIRCGCPSPDPATASGPTFFLLSGKDVKVFCVCITTANVFVQSLLICII